MERRSSKHRVFCGKGHSGCIWQLIRILNFRPADSHGKLISDGSHFRRHVVGTGCSRSRHSLPSNFDENCQDIDEAAGYKSRMVDNGERSVKKLARKEMLTEQLLENGVVAPKLKHLHSDSGHVCHIKNCKKAHKICRRAHHSSVHHQKEASSVGHHQPSSPNRLNLAVMSEAFCNQVHPENQGHYTDLQRYDQLNEINLQQLPISESSLKKLQDPDFLFTTQVQELLDAHTMTEKNKLSSEDNFSEYGMANSKRCKEPAWSMKFKKQKMHILLRKIRSQHSHPSKGSDDPRSSNRILVLKPDPKGMKNAENTASCYTSLWSHYSLGNKGQDVKPTYSFFSDIKRKFKDAMKENRKKLHWIPTDGILHELPCELIDGTERTRRAAQSSAYGKIGGGLEFGSIGEPLCRKLTFSAVSYSKQLEFNMNLEAKRHLSERLNKVDKDGTYLSKQNPRSLGRILSSPEHDLLVTLGSEGDKERGFVFSQMRFSPYSNFQKADESSWQLQEENKMNCWSPLRRNASAPLPINNSKHDDQMQIFESKPNSPEKLCNTTLQESICSARGNSISNNGAQPGDFNLLEMPSKAYRTIVTSAEQRDGVANTCEEFVYRRCSGLDLSLENKPLTSLDAYSSCPLSICKARLVDSKDGEGHPSPVSVLEPPFIDNVTIHRGTIPKPGMQPLQVDLEEQSLPVYTLNPQINSNASLIDHVHIPGYVRTVLQASALNWDELSLMQQSSDQPLLPAYLMELFPVESYCDHKLIFDCIEEVLLEVYQCYFGSSPLVSFLEPKIRPASLEDRVVREVMKAANWYFFPPLKPRTLDQIVENDMTKSRSWIDIRLDAEGIVADIVEAILEELKMETTWEIQI